MKTSVLHKEEQHEAPEVQYVTLYTCIAIWHQILCVTASVYKDKCLYCYIEYMHVSAFYFEFYV